MTIESEKTVRTDSRSHGLFSLRGEINRLPFAAVGIGLFLAKYALDCTVSNFVFGRAWSIFNYLSGQQASLLFSAAPEDRFYFWAMLLIALPFIWIGVALTTRRLRSAGMPIGLVFLFFLPTINLLFLATMTTVASRGGRTAQARKSAPTYRDIISRAVPRNPFASAVFAVCFTIVAGLAISGLSVYVLEMYGLGLFVGAPFGMGLISTIVFGFCGYRTGAAYRFVSIASVVGLELLMFAIGAEGMGCLFMALPIWIVAGVLGGFVGEAIQQRAADKREMALSTLVIIVAVPALLGMEYLTQPNAPTHMVMTSLRIEAPPERVWKNVVGFPDLPPPTEWLFRLGIAYPISASIDETGGTGERRCEFNTGTFVEPITVWNPPIRLQFSVTKNPPPMREWSFYENVHAPHLEGFLCSRAGQFVLKPQANGGTRLEGSTWYEHNMRPVGYWRFWSDRIIATIHRRVLRHIKTLSESPRAITIEVPQHVSNHNNSRESQE